MKVLVVDDDRELVDLLGFVLFRAGFESLATHDRPTALRVLDKQVPDAVVLDAEMGRGKGLDLLRELKLRRQQTPIVVLTAGSEDDRIQALDQGADDCLSKPFSYRELVARLRARLRSQAPELSAEAPAPELRVGSLTLNPSSRRVMKNGQQLLLSATEFRLLHYLMTRAGTVVPARELLRHVWGYEETGGKDLLRVTAYRLRRKIEDEPQHPRLLHTVPGVGLILERSTD